MQLLSMHNTAEHDAAPPAPPIPPSAARKAKADRPSIDMGVTTERWVYFQKRWNTYKISTGLAGADIQGQLMDTCSEQLRYVMFQDNNDIEQQPELHILESIRRLAVKAENVMVSRVVLNNLQQQADEGIRNFTARVKGQADLCQFTKQCTCTNTVRYTDEMVRDVIIRGLYDQDTQRDVLGMQEQDMQLDALIKLLEAKEIGKKTQASILGETGASISRYKRDKNPSRADDQNKPGKCHYCGRAGHGTNENGRISKANREANCPAFAATCNKCSLTGHFSAVCRKRTPQKWGKADKMSSTPYSGYNEKMTTKSEDSASATDRSVYEEMCGASISQPCGTPADGARACDGDTNVKTIATEEMAHVTSIGSRGSTKCYNEVVIESQQFNKLRGWIERPVKGQPTITLQARIVPSDYAHFGYRFTKPARTCQLRAITDTGCQSTIMNLEQVHKMGYKKSDLIPTQLRMQAIDTNPIEIIGAIIIRLSGFDIQGNSHETTQICYVSNKIKGMYLSEHGCKQLGIIPESFPSVGAVNSDNDVAASSSTRPPSTRDTCNCPRRTMPPPLPTSVPLPPIDNNRGKLEEWIRDYYKGSTFNVCEHQPLPLMEGPPVRIMVDPKASPVTIHTPISVPLHWQKQVKADLDRDIALGVIEPVPVGEPMTWCSRMVITRKKSGGPRRCVDYQALNKFCSRETHHTMSPFHQATLFPANMKKTVTDAWNGYHSVAIHEEDRHYTTFITPWGRYRYKTLPQGFVAAGDGYTRRYDEVVADIPHKTKCIDDVGMWAPTIEEAFFQTCKWMDICGRHGITQNPEKFHFAKETVEFAGFEITTTNIRPSDTFIRAIKDFPTPRNITDVRSLFGLINQVSYCQSSSEELRPFRELLSPSTPFYWDDTMDAAFAHAKSEIVKTIAEGVKIFDKRRKTCLSTDWCKNGIGFSLGQKHCSCPSDEPWCCQTGWKLTFASNRYTHNAEENYAPVEGEALAVAWALDKARHFVLGCNDLIVATDHKPLLKVLGDRKMEDIKNPRLYNLKEKTLPFLFRITYVPGKRHFTADSLSRYASGDPNPNKMDLPDDAHATSYSPVPTRLRWSQERRRMNNEEDHSHEAAAQEEYLTLGAMTTLSSIESVTWDNVREQTTSDPTMRQLHDTILMGFPEDSRSMPELTRIYHQYRSDLSIVEGVILYQDRIVIPPSLRDQVLETLHAAHQGVTSMNARAKASVFWPGITIQIQELRNNCQACHRIAPSNPKPPPTPSPDPVYPFQMICADYFCYGGHNYLVIVDRYSGWPYVCQLTGASPALVKKLREFFVTYGIAEELASDGGPEFTAAFTQQFLRDWGVAHRLSSVAYPHSNTRAEIGVKSAKRMIMENTGPQGDVDIPAFQRAMLTYRNTPTPLDKRSPAEIVFGRQIRDFVPVMPGKYEPCDTWTDTAANREKALMERHAKEVEALLPHTKKMPPLKVGNRVRVQNQTGNAPRRWDKSGQVVEVRQNDQYAIKVHGSGRVTLRNRQFLRLYVPHTEKPCPRRITDDIPNRPADIGRLPLSVFPTEDLTREISTPLGSDAHRPPPTPATLRTPQRTPTHLQGQQLNPHSLNFEPNTEDAGTPATSPRPSAENTSSPAAPQQTTTTSPPSAGLPDIASRPDRPRRQTRMPTRFNDYVVARH